MRITPKINNDLFKITDLKVSIDGSLILNNLNFSISKNQILAIVGESGSGKTITALSLLGLLPEKKLKQSGSISFNSFSLIGLKQKQWQKIRGNKIGVVFQEPQSSLNPSMRCGSQIKEVLDVHFPKKFKSKECRQLIIEQLIQVKLPDPNRIYQAYPHEISGGQKQRVMIAMALICKPQLLIADEPTTALDVLVQKDIIELIKEIQLTNSMSVLFISHDLSLVSEIADKIIVMNKGVIVEQGKTSKIFSNPQDNYTKGLLNSRPPLNLRLKRLPTINDNHHLNLKENIIDPTQRKIHHKNIYSKAPLLKIKKLSKKILVSSWFSSKKPFDALKEITFKLYPGETLGILGASGCGKSTLGRALIFLDPATSGDVFFKNKLINLKISSQIKDLRKNIQFVFQDSYSALHPKKTIGNIIYETVNFYEKNSIEENINRVNELLDQVGLSKEFFNRYSFEISGGQRQRIVIARALSVKPKVLIFDESVAALDISVQARILNLLNKLKKELNLSFIFISHDLSVVKHMSDKIMVMDKGRIIEYTEADDLYKNPKSEITKKLIDSIPGISFRN